MSEMKLSRLVLLVCVLACAGCASLATRPVPPKVEVDAVRFALTATGEARIRVALDVQNPNPYDIAVRSIDAAFRIEDVPVATATLLNAATLPASGRTYVEIEARPDVGALREVLDRALRKLSASYEITGTAVVQDGVRLEFRRRGDIALTDLLGRLR